MTRAEAARILGQYDVSFFKFYETDGAESRRKKHDDDV